MHVSHSAPLLHPQRSMPLMEAAVRRPQNITGIRRYKTDPIPDSRTLPLANMYGWPSSSRGTEGIGAQSNAPARYRRRGQSDQGHGNRNDKQGFRRLQ